MQRRNVHLPEELVARARLDAVKRGVTVADVIRLALSEYLDRLKHAQGASRERK